MKKEVEVCDLCSSTIAVTKCEACGKEICRDCGKEIVFTYSSSEILCFSDRGIPPPKEEMRGLILCSRCFTEHKNGLENIFKLSNGSKKLITTKFLLELKERIEEVLIAEKI
jgi:hypothetical protein